jgi:RNA polymerase sigma-70 factor (ECF subfamily)
VKHVTDDDGHILSRAATGDAEALRTLLERHGPAVWAAVDANIGSAWRASIDADDVMQVTYMEAFLQINRLDARDAAGFGAWLRRMAENNLRDAIKALGRKKRPDPLRRVQTGSLEESCVALVEMLAATSATPSRHAARGEISRVVEKVLEQLPPLYARAVRLYDLEGRSIADVARELGRSAGAVHMLRARAHDRLRAMLGSESRFFSDAS